MKAVFPFDKPAVLPFPLFPMSPAAQWWFSVTYLFFGLVESSRVHIFFHLVRSPFAEFLKSRIEKTFFFFLFQVSLTVGRPCLDFFSPFPSHIE